MGSPYTCILFDVDNTLVDTDPLIREALRECGCPEVDHITERGLRSTSPPQILKTRGCGHLTGRYWDLYDQLAAVEACLFDEQTTEVLDALRNRGTALGIVTSCRKPTTVSLLSRCGILEFFDGCLVTYGTCRQHKPNPAPIECALGKLGREPAGSLYVGDSEKDERASHAAGAQFGLAGWARLTGEERAVLMPDVVLGKVADLLDYA